MQMRYEYANTPGFPVNRRALAWPGRTSPEKGKEMKRTRRRMGLLDGTKPRQPSRWEKTSVFSRPHLRHPSVPSGSSPRVIKKVGVRGSVGSIEGLCPNLGSIRMIIYFSRIHAKPNHFSRCQEVCKRICKGA